MSRMHLKKMNFDTDNDGSDTIITSSPSFFQNITADLINNFKDCKCINTESCLKRFDKDQLINVFINLRSEFHKNPNVITLLESCMPHL